MRFLPWVAISALASVATLGGCGGGSPTAPQGPATTTTTTALPVTRTVILQGSQAIPADWHYEWWFTTTRAGTLDITVDWTYADSNIYVRLGQGKCDEQVLKAGQCQWLIQSNMSTPKPRVLTLPNAAAGQYTLYIYNGPKQRESVSYLVELTA